MLVLNEIITGTLKKYNYNSKTWVQVMELNNSNVDRADSQRQCTNDDCFQIGGCFSATMNITLKIPPPLSVFQVRGCKITLVSSLAGAIGVFFVTNASRRGRIFTLVCHDSVAWTETSSYRDTSNSNNGIHNILYSYEGVFSNTAQGWMNELFLTRFTNNYIACATGISNLLTWEYYHKNENIIDACNSEIQFGIDADSGSGDTDCPRDFYKYLAEVSFGFVYATPETGNLTLGQFAESRWGVAEIQANEIERDSDDFADYNCYMRTVTAYGTDAGGNKEGFSWAITPQDFSTASMFDIVVENNPFLDGSYQNELAKGNSGYDFLGVIATNFYQAFHRPAEIVQQGYGFLVSPFKCTVHGQHTFHLGQKVLIHYVDYDGTIKNHDSIITKICWSLYGGQTIMCCGGDSRTLSQTLQNSKGDKVRKDVQNHCDAIKRRTVGLSQAEYDALENPDEHTLYCII